MILTGKGPHPEPGSHPPRMRDQLAAGRLLLLAAAGDLESMKSVIRIVYGAVLRLDPDTRAAIGIEDPPADPHPSAEEIAREAAWPDDPLRALIALGDLPETYQPTEGKE